MIAAIYSRKSKFTGKGESIDNQIEMCKEYASKYLNIDEFIEYEDEGCTGANLHRDDFKRLMSDAKLKKFDVLICYRLDRISRNVADFSSTLSTLQNYNIDFVSIKEQFDTSSPMGRAMVYIASVFAQLERETIAERVKDNMMELAKTGRWLGGVSPIGFDSSQITYLDENLKERKMSKLTQNKEELKIVQLLFDKYLELKSLSAVETYTLQNNIKTKKGSYFSKNNLRIILTNTVYVRANNKVINHLNSLGIQTCGEIDNNCGLLSYNKQKTVLTETGAAIRSYRDMSEWITTVSSHSGIIDADKWLMVQQLLKDNKSKFPNEGKTHNALFTGILRCSKCGANMQIAHGHLSKKTGKKFYYYSCSMKKNSKSSVCDNKNGKVEEIDYAVIESLKELGNSKMNILKKIKEENKKSKSVRSTLNNQNSIKLTIQSNEKKIDNLLNKLSIDESLDDLILSKIKKIKLENEDLQNSINTLNILDLNSNEESLNLAFIELLLNRCSIIDTLEPDEIKQLASGLIEYLGWNGETGKIKFDFIGSKEESKKKL
ncbi:recombinase family protein [Clostridium gasigenes]|uniref:recombinase family protein n=1 Tax=Clostridium gasigenes TaxID=94869 RepID=UPI00162ABD37|nr:recombinase family protein [Clostridium gasigenes]MBB6622537.1 recombinase family protein [Clostridium gasigenes]